MYLRIEEALEDRIRTGEWVAGSRIPTERELADRLGVSRMTLRHALGRLEQRGLLTRHQGRGTFVAAPKFKQSLSILSGFFEEMQEQGIVPSSRVLSAARVLPGQAVARVLRVDLSDPVYKLVRLRLAGNEPLVLATTYLPARLIPDLLDQDLEHESIYGLMARRGVRPVAAEQTLEPVLARASEAEALGIATGSPVMLIERTAWATDGQPVEYAKDIYRGDRTRFVAQLHLK